MLLYSAALCSFIFFLLLYSAAKRMYLLALDGDPATRHPIISRGGGSCTYSCSGGVGGQGPLTAMPSVVVLDGAFRRGVVLHASRRATPQSCTHGDALRRAQATPRSCFESLPPDHRLIRWSGEQGEYKSVARTRAIAAARRPYAGSSRLMFGGQLTRWARACVVVRPTASVQGGGYADADRMGASEAGHARR